MSTEHEVLRKGGTRFTLDEHRGVANLHENITEDCGGCLIFDLTADEIARMAVEMLKVASYLDPEAITRTAQHLGEKDDWDYYAETIRGLL